jgi:hypothetical protein
MNEQKPGHQTSEFWLTCGAAITTFVASLSTDDKDKSIMYGIITALVILKYLYGRYRLKLAAQAAQSQANDSPNIGQQKEEPKDTPKKLTLILAAMLFLCFSCVVSAGPRVRIYAPPVVVIPSPIAPRPILPYTIILVDPLRPLYPTLPVHVQPSPQPSCFQFVPLTR